MGWLFLTLKNLHQMNQFSSHQWVFFKFIYSYKDFWIHIIDEFKFWLSSSLCCQYLKQVWLWPQKAPGMGGQEPCVILLIFLLLLIFLPFLLLLFLLFVLFWSFIIINPEFSTDRQTNQPAKELKMFWGKWKILRSLWRPCIFSSPSSPSSTSS